MKTLLFSTLFLFTFMLSLFATDENEYKVRTLEISISYVQLGIDELYKKYPMPEEPGPVFMGPDNKLKTTVKYLNQIREITKEERENLKQWCLTDLSKICKSYNYSILVSENKKKYWIPVHDSIVGDLKKIKIRNQKIMIYAQFLGYINKEYLFLVNYFKIT